MFGFFLSKGKDIAAEAAAAYRREDYASALKIAQMGLQRQPRNQSLLAIAGNCFFVQGEYRTALDFYQKILQDDPHNPEAQINRCEALLFLNQPAEAWSAAQDLPDTPQAQLTRGKIEMAREHYAAAENFLTRAAAAGQCFWTYNLLSQAAQKNAHWQTALEAAWQAVKLSGGLDSQHLNMAYTLYEIASETSLQTVSEMLQKWLAEYAGNPIVEQSRNAFFPSPEYVRSHPEYVTAVFDNFADSFEEILSDLHYCAPQLIGAEIHRRFPEFLLSKTRILDLGCGTGLMGKEIDSRCRNYHMDGVDLSAEMLKKAAAKKLYENLFLEDAETYLTTTSQQYDLITAADVLTYFGALENLFAAVAEKLVSKGVFVFTVSAAPNAEKKWCQHLSGRFLHSRSYVQNTLQKCGFCNINCQSSVLRLEGGNDVSGFLFSAQKT